MSESTKSYSHGCTNAINLAASKRHYRPKHSFNVLTVCSYPFCAFLWYKYLLLNIIFLSRWPVNDTCILSTFILLWEICNLGELSSKTLPVQFVVIRASSSLLIVEDDVRCPELSDGNANGINAAVVVWIPRQ